MSSELSESFTIIGVGVPSITEGMKNISVVSHRTCRIADQELGAANASTSRAKKRISAVAAADPRYSIDSVVRPGRVSAILPPSQLPIASPASTTPITDVHV